MSKRFFKVVPLAAAVSAVMFTGGVVAEESTESVIQEVVSNPTDILTDGWTVNGYIRTGVRFTDRGVSSDSEFGKPDYATAGTTGHNANQVEFVIGKKTEFQNGVWSELGIRAEYGNGNSYFYSSPGSEAQNDTDEGRFEIKEAFMKLGGMDYLPEDAHIWAGRRFLNRSAGLLSGEFWKQSSGMGFGYEQAGTGVALVSVDPGEGSRKAEIEGEVGQRATMHSLDLYTYGHEGLGGSFDFDLKIMQQGSENKFKNAYGKDASTDGFGLAITYNRDWYGFDGWSQTGLAYGEGMAANRGVNFGAWSGGFPNGGTATNKDAKTWFFTSYGVLNINDSWQMGSEVTYLYGENIWSLSKANDGQDTIHRALVAARPTYRVNDNFRWEWTASYGYQNGPGDWIGGSTKTESGRVHYYTAEMAAVFTVNADYFGRPQIKPFVTYLHKDTKEGYGWGGEFGDRKGVWQFGVEAEIWF